MIPILQILPFLCFPPSPEVELATFCMCNTQYNTKYTHIVLLLLPRVPGAGLLISELADVHMSALH
jgi:hypothetical protein